MKQAEHLLLKYFSRAYPIHAGSLQEEETAANRDRTIELYRLYEDWKSGKLDSVMGLFARGFGFRLLHPEIQASLFPGQSFQHDDVVILTEQSLQNAIGNSITVAFGDVSFLSLLNDVDSHQAGDMLLRRIGEKTNSLVQEDFVFTRYGGDEIFVAALRQSLDAVITQVKAWQRAIGEIRIEALQSRGLSPHIDVGIGTLAEAVQFLLEHKSSDDRRLLSTIADTLISIADHRSSYAKCIVRLRTLARMRLRDPGLYIEVIGFLGKGANNPSDKVIHTLAGLLEKGDEESLMRESKALALRGSDADPMKKFALRAYRESLRRS